jgi:hypothetical protein
MMTHGMKVVMISMKFMSGIPYIADPLFFDPAKVANPGDLGI